MTYTKLSTIWKTEAKKLQDKPPKRLWCNRMKEGLSEWQPFSESDVYNQIADISTVRATAVSTSVNPTCMDSSSESDEVDNTGTVVQRSVRANRERFSVVRQKSKQIEDLTAQVASLQESVKRHSANERTLYRKIAKRKAECVVVPDPNEHKSRLRDLTDDQKKLELAGEIVASVKKFYPRTSDEKCAGLLLDMVNAGTLYGAHGVVSEKQTHVHWLRVTYPRVAPRSVA